MSKKLITTFSILQQIKTTTRIYHIIKDTKKGGGNLGKKAMQENIMDKQIFE